MHLKTKLFRQTSQNVIWYMVFVLWEFLDHLNIKTIYVLIFNCPKA